MGLQYEKYDFLLKSECSIRHCRSNISNSINRENLFCLHNIVSNGFGSVMLHYRGKQYRLRGGIICLNLSESELLASQMNKEEIEEHVLGVKLSNYSTNKALKLVRD